MVALRADSSSATWRRCLAREPAAAARPASAGRPAHPPGGRLDLGAVAVGAQHVQGAAGGGAVGGARAADRAGGHGLPKPPAVIDVARASPVRNRRNRRNIAGGGVADGILVVQHVRNTRACCGSVAAVLGRSATVLTCGFPLLLGLLRLLREVASPGVGEVGALVAARGGLAYADHLGLDPVRAQQLGQST